VDVSGVKVPETVNDAFFARVQQPKEGEAGFFNNAEKINPDWLEKRKAVQQQVDTSLVAACEKVPHMLAYLKSKFALQKGMAPHLMKF